MATKMTKRDARAWVREHNDNDVLDQDELEAAYTALYGCEPDDQDREEGLWSHCCAAVFH